MARDSGKILYETHEEVLRAATKQKDAEIRDLKRIIEGMRTRIDGLLKRLGELPEGPVETAKRILR